MSTFVIDETELAKAGNAIFAGGMGMKKWIVEFVPKGEAKIVYANSFDEIRPAQVLADIIKEQDPRRILMVRRNPLL